MSVAWQMYAPAMMKLMLAIGAEMSNDAEEWIKNTFITQFSTMDDFSLEPASLERISATVGVRVKQRSRLGSIADRMNELPEFKEINAREESV